MRRRSASEGGQATVELVLVLPVVVALALLGIQIGLVARDRVLVAHVARETARVAAVDPDPAAATAAAHRASSLDPDRLTVELGPDRQPGGRLLVTVRYRSPTAVPVVGGLVGDVTLATEVTVRVE